MIDVLEVPTAEGQGAEDQTMDQVETTPDQTGKRSSAPVSGHMLGGPIEQLPAGLAPAAASDASSVLKAAEPRPDHDDSEMVEVEVEVELSLQDRGISGMSTAEGPGVTGPTEDQEEATLDPTGKRFSAPDSDSEELVPVDTETDTVQEGRRCPAPASDSDELIPAATRRAEGVRPGDAPSPLRPWTQADTDLSKAMTRVLRHRSNLQLDEAGYAKLTEVLAHPVMRRIHPTMDWMMYIVKANAKRRFALDETGTLIRAVQGHSIPVASSQLFRRLESRDFGATVPKWALHSTYFACIPSIMRHGLLPGGTRGTRHRRHVHLAMSYHPTAGLREGSDVILVVDLARAHNAGCVFYVSDNNVILTADCIPPPCISRAQRTSTGEAFDLSTPRAAYKVVGTACHWSVGTSLGPDHLTAWSSITTQLAVSHRCRYSSSSASGAHGPLSRVVLKAGAHQGCTAIPLPSLS